MLRSKATAALKRLKEMDRKYNIKHKEGKRGFGNVSTESSLENTPRSPQPKASDNKLELVQTFLATNCENETASKVSSESTIEMQIQSPRFEDVHLKKFSRTSPRTKTEASAEVETSKESASRTEETLRTVSNLDFASGNDLKATFEIKEDVSEESQRHDEDSSVTTVFSRRSGAPETISEAIKSRNEPPLKRSNGKSNVTEEITPRSSAQASDLDDDESTIDEIISELSNAMDKDNSETEDSSNSSSTDEKLQYESTFEEASNSTASSSSTAVRLKKSLVEKVAEDTAVSGVKQIKITPHKPTESIQEEVKNDEKDKEVIELIGPKAIRSNSECDAGLDEELSNYVKTTENVDVVVPINLLKLSKQAMPARRHVRRSRRHRRLSNENTDAKIDTSFVSDDRERLTEPKASRNEAVASKENSSSATIEVAPVGSTDVEKEVVKNESEELQKEPKTISSELLREIPKKSDVTSTLRELNKDAINAIVRRHRVQTTSKIPDKSRRGKNYKAIVKLPSAEASENVEDDQSKPASQENVIMDSSHRHKVRGKRTKTKRASKASKARRASHQGKAEDCGQTRHLRKQAAVLRMQQEREDIRNYLLELERTRLEFGPGESILSSKITAFKPLEFPKILTFKKPNLEDANLDSNDAVVALQEKILMIRQWLKDQYLLYRDYSKLAQTMNAKYIPASLEDAKKTIRQLQRATVESR